MIAPETTGKGRNQTVFGRVEPRCQFAPTCIAYHVGEPVRQFPGDCQGWQCSFNLRDLERIGPGQVISSHGQKSGNPARWWRFAGSERHSLRGAALACRQLTDDPETALKAICLQSAPELCAIPTAAAPFPFQLRQPRCQAALTDAKTSSRSPRTIWRIRPRLSPVRRTIRFIGTPSPAIRRTMRLVC